jgi:hypothetical protein
VDSGEVLARFWWGSGGSRQFWSVVISGGFLAASGEFLRLGSGELFVCSGGFWWVLVVSKARQESFLVRSGALWWVPVV